MDQKRLNKKMIVLVGTCCVVILTFLGYITSSFSDKVNMLNKKTLLISVETIHFGSPQIKSDKGNLEKLVISEGSSIDLVSAKFKVKHEIKVDRLTADTVHFSESKSIDKKSGFLIPHVKNKMDTKGFTLTNSKHESWQKELNKEELLILIQTGIQGAGVQWQISIFNEN